MEFETEEQQIEAIKKWFKEYGPTIVIGLVIGLGGVFGFREYQEYSDVQKQTASDTYEAIMVTQTATPDKDQFANAITDFRASHGDTIYANLLELHRAKFAVVNKDLVTAETALSNVVNSAAHPTVEHTARLRLARVLIALEKYEAALTVISEAKDSAYEYSYELLRGDVWLARGDQERAKAAYEKAKELASDAPQHPDLDMVLTELASVGKEEKKQMSASSGESND